MSESHAPGSPVGIPVTGEQALQRLQAAEVQHVPLTTLQTDETLQPRDARMVPLRDRGRVEVRSTEHVGTMRLVLEAAHSIQLEPLLVAKFDRALFVVDGHHRLKAYRQAGRDKVPARVMHMDRRMAVLVSKLVNCGSRALEMHPEQRRDAAWQYVAHLTRQGANELPSGESLRTIAGHFGISKDTVSNMLRKLPKVNPKAYPIEQCDSGTGFPRWKAVRDWRKQNEDDDQGEQPMSLERWTQREAERVAKKLGMLESGTTAEAWKLALMMYAAEAKLEAANDDTRTFLAEISETGEEEF